MLGKDQDKIIERFIELARPKQLELLAWLNQKYGPGNEVAEFSEWHQKELGSSVRFTISEEVKDNTVVIKAIIHTRYGSFEAFGPNQKLAKYNATFVARIEHGKLQKNK